MNFPTEIAATESGPGPDLQLSTRDRQLPSPTAATAKSLRLPRPVCDQIKPWILDGLSYPDLIQHLGEYGKGHQEFPPIAASESDSGAGRRS